MRNKKAGLQLICWLVIIVSFINIVGWIIDAEILKTMMPGLPSMKINTAICLILCAVVVLLYNNDAHKHFNTIIPLNLIVLVVSSLTLFEYVFDVNLKIDEFMVKEDSDTVTPGRMALTSATCLTLLATGFAFIIAQAPSMFNNVARLFFYIVTLITFLATVGYLFNIPSLHNLTLSKSMALVTAVLLFPLSLVYASLIPGCDKKI